MQDASSKGLARHTSRRSKQLIEAQASFRNRKREAGCQRIQEWVNKETLAQLRAVAKNSGLSRARILEMLVAAVYAGKIDLHQQERSNADGTWDAE
ncbi:hypothetical protein ACSZNP_02310 [Aeromonas hydrophila]|uniref:hypothetical protein n=1 Tax=Aeromonas dhakensis TaxID=196024 RepID=UPI00300E318C